MWGGWGLAPTLVSYPILKSKFIAGTGTKESEHNMLDLLELTYGRYNGGQTGPIGSYLNPRTMAIYQLTSDGVLPQDGTWVRVDPSGTQTFANIATTLNTLLNTTYTSGSFHTHGSSDIIANPGQMSNDS
jgi:hypothetical protein